MQERKIFELPLIDICPIKMEDIILTSHEEYDPDGIFAENGDMLF